MVNCEGGRRPGVVEYFWVVTVVLAVVVTLRRVISSNGGSLKLPTANKEPASNHRIRAHTSDNCHGPHRNDDRTQTFGSRGQTRTRQRGKKRKERAGEERRRRSRRERRERGRREGTRTKKGNGRIAAVVSQQEHWME